MAKKKNDTLTRKKDEAIGFLIHELGQLFEACVKVHGLSHEEIASNILIHLIVMGDHFDLNKVDERLKIIIEDDRKAGAMSDAPFAKSLVEHGRSQEADSCPHSVGPIDRQEP